MDPNPGVLLLNSAIGGNLLEPFECVLSALFILLVVPNLVDNLRIRLLCLCEFYPPPAPDTDLVKLLLPSSPETFDGLDPEQPIINSLESVRVLAGKAK